MDKIALKETLIKAHRKTLDHLREEYINYQSSGELNLEDVRDADDDSHREQAEEFLHAMERQITQRRREIEALQSLDFGGKTFVTEGAVALVNDQYYVIGVPACQFDLEGRHFIAMSADAPFYLELMGRKQNDSFVFNGKEFKVESIF